MDKDTYQSHRNRVKNIIAFPEEWTVYGVSFWKEKLELRDNSLWICSLYDGQWKDFLACLNHLYPDLTHKPQLIYLMPVSG